MPQILSMGNYAPPVTKENPIKVLIENFRAADRFLKIQLLVLALFLFAIPVATKSLIFDNRQNAAGVPLNTTYDLQSYYPNPDLFKGYYLEGKNYAATPSSRSVLWFEPQDQWSFKLYNSAPDDPTYARCNYDVLSWWDDGFLRYSKTHNDCPGNTPNDIVYDAPIIFLPKVWNSATPWTLSATSGAKFYQNGVLKCEGVLSYKADILGVEQIAPNEPGVHWRTTQTTNWTSGNVPGSCAAGYATHWQEDYWLTDQLPAPSGGNAKGLKRAKGGNTDITSGNWDVWFDKWQALPGAPTVTPKPSTTPTPSPLPTKTPTPTPTPIPQDITPPTVLVTSPLNGSTINKNSVVTIKANASDNKGVSKVVFFVNGTQKCIDITSVYSCSWIVPAVKGANYTISAFAYDGAGNSASSFVQVKSK